MDFKQTVLVVNENNSGGKGLEFFRSQLTVGHDDQAIARHP